MKSAKEWEQQLRGVISVEFIRQIQLDAIISALEQVTADPTPRKRAGVILSAIAGELLRHPISE